MIYIMVIYGCFSTKALFFKVVITLVIELNSISHIKLGFN